MVERVKKTAAKGQQFFIAAKGQQFFIAAKRQQFFYSSGESILRHGAKDPHLHA